MNGRRILAVAATALLFTACVSAAIDAPTSSLAPTSPGTSPTVVPGATTLAPGETATPFVPPTGGVTDPPTTPPTGGVTDPPTTPPTTPPTAPPTSPPTAPPPPTYGTGQAGSHIGELATVCGHVNASNFVPTAIGIPTFLNLDSAYPTQTFNVVIWGSQRDAFDTAPEVKFQDKDVCVTGVIQQYETWLQIQAGRTQIKLQH
ncbi:MAG: hypothetical protein ABIZ34_09035 [Candidatus Limnocylindrales bacterium]